MHQNNRNTSARGAELQAGLDNIRRQQSSVAEREHLDRRNIEKTQARQQCEIRQRKAFISEAFQNFFSNSTSLASEQEKTFLENTYAAILDFSIQVIEEQDKHRSSAPAVKIPGPYYLMPNFSNELPNPKGYLLFCRVNQAQEKQFHLMISHTDIARNEQIHLNPPGEILSLLNQLEWPQGTPFEPVSLNSELETWIAECCMDKGKVSINIRDFFWTEEVSKDFRFHLSLKAEESQHIDGTSRTAIHKEKNGWWGSGMAWVSNVAAGAYHHGNRPVVYKHSTVIAPKAGENEISEEREAEIHLCLAAIANQFFHKKRTEIAQGVIMNINNGARPL